MFVAWDEASILGIRTQMRLRDKEGLIRTGARLRDLDVREMKASRVEDAPCLGALSPVSLARTDINEGVAICRYCNIYLYIYNI